MSVINQMLRDLDARRALRPGIDATAPAIGISAWAGSQRRSGRPVAATALVLLLAAGAVSSAALQSGRSAPGTVIETVPIRLPAVEQPVFYAPDDAAPRSSGAPETNEAPTRTSVPEPTGTSEPTVTSEPAVASEPTVTHERTVTPETTVTSETTVAPEAPVAPETVKAAEATVALESMAADDAAASLAAPDIGMRPLELAAAGPSLPSMPTPPTPAVADGGTSGPAPSRTDGTQPSAASADRSYRQGLTHYGAGRIDDALSAFEEALAIDPRHAEATKAMAAILVERSDLDGAQRILQAALELDPLQAELAMLAARIAQRQGDPAQALRVLERAVHESAPAELYAAIAGTLGVMHRDAQAIPHWLEALKRTPSRAPWWVGLGLAFESAGRQADAAAAYDRALALPALSPEAAQFARERLLALR